MEILVIDRERGGGQRCARNLTQQHQQRGKKRSRRLAPLLLCLAWMCIATGALFGVRKVSAYSLEQQSVFYEEDYKTLHMDHILRMHCPSDFLAKRDLSACVNATQKSVRSFKMSSFYYYKQELMTQAPVRLQLNPQEQPLYDAFLQRESTLSAYHQKLNIAQDAADDHRVRTICLVGLRGGLALTNFIVSNPTAKFVVFDGLEDARFSLAHLQIIQGAHPTRSVVLVAGELRYSIRNFLLQFPKQQCQVLYLDVAGHSSPSLASPTALAGVLEQAMMLVDPLFNRVLVNDFEHPDIGSAFQYVFQKIRTGLTCPTCARGQLTSPKLEDSQCEGNLRTNISITAYFKGFLPTPCVVMYTNSTGGRHMEFLFSLQHCMPNVPAETIQQPEIDNNVEMVMVTMSSVYVEPDSLDVGDV